MLVGQTGTRTTRNYIQLVGMRIQKAGRKYEQHPKQAEEFPGNQQSKNRAPAMRTVLAQNCQPEPERNTKENDAGTQMYGRLVRALNNRGKVGGPKENHLHDGCGDQGAT